MLEAFRRLTWLPRAASTMAEGIDELHLFVIGVTLLGVAVLTLIMLYLVVRYRRRPTPMGEESTPVVTVTGRREALLVGGTLTLFVVWWLIGYHQFLNLHRRPVGPSVVYVVAKQWMWKFSHSSGQLENNVLTVPVGRPVELVMISRDVIHSFFVPAMRVKQDVLPGRYVTLWFEPREAGIFPIYCAEYCGIRHSDMLGEVHVLEGPEYQQFLSDAAASRPLAEIGREAALRHACFSCHTVDGQSHIGPSWSRLYGSEVSLTDGQHVTADPAYLTESMMDPAAHIVAGYAPVMPTYLGSLDSAETAAIVEYIRSLQAGPIAKTIQLPPVTQAGNAGQESPSSGARP
jgi:cytochrome c oxidase subunit 2